ncbi:MAG: tRNA (adenosine(37)-N6)-dimethylallyltransferase MiaA, partial [Acidobacteriota bacterium]|nr:tRNA (adenosine(37)-N6)-dimethylallyltransferase MiaA [Acidobacteriota bacterium]MDQ5873287.1 tRNA (adenosine(37)-N6)-dimethylallyltransferase MiaA [Acidobacteriota bacterium]
AKPSLERRAEVRYHLVDVADPGESFSAGRWAAEARRAIEDISSRGKLPIVCGGSGFYISALLDGLPPGEARDPELRARLEAWGRKSGAAAAHRFLARNDPASAARISFTNLRYVLRALEIVLTTGARASERKIVRDPWPSRFRVIKVAVEPPRRDLYARIEMRVRGMMDAGWDDEVRRLVAAGHSLESNAFGAIGYRELGQWISARAEREDTEREIVAATKRLARRQKTWFARERDALRVDPAEALSTILQLLDRGVETE